MLLLLLIMAVLDQLRAVLRELFMEYLSGSCKFSLHWKATSLYLLSPANFPRQVEALRQVGIEWLWMSDWLG